MLKFSGFASLTSCLKCMVIKIMTASPKMPEHSQLQSTETLLDWPAYKSLSITSLRNVATCACQLLRLRRSQQLIVWEEAGAEMIHNDTEASMLLGISQKHNMCSSPCRLTEFCNSQCLSHFAAPFIVARTETSIAKSCKLFMAFSVDGIWKQIIIFSMSSQWMWTTMSAFRPTHHSWVSARAPIRLSLNRLHKRIHKLLTECVRMILPQVHLRKPCYDFSFL